MDKLLEIIRRLSMVVIWTGGGVLSLMMIVLSFSEDNTNRIGTVTIGLGALLLTWLVAKVVNWIFIK